MCGSESLGCTSAPLHYGGMLTLTMLMRSLSGTVIKTYTWCMKKQVLMHRCATEDGSVNLIASVAA